MSPKDLEPFLKVAALPAVFIIAIGALWVVAIALSKIPTP